MPGTRKRTKGGSPVQKELARMAEPEVELEAEEAGVLGNCRLPLEICQHIFKKLDSEEKITFSRTLIPWHELVSKERTDFLCSKGAPILIEHLPKKALRQFRTLSSSWTQELDHHYQNHPDHVRLPFEIGKKWIPKHINDFNSAGQIQEFLKDMRDHPGNPFPGGYVFTGWLPKFPQELETDFFNNLLQLFSQFGKHVYYVVFMNFRFEYLRKCLIKLSNLKGLTIFNSLERLNLPTQNCYSLPRLRNLEVLETQFVSEHLVELILDSCPIPKNMKRLSLETPFLTKIPEIVFSFINLEVVQGYIDILDFQRFKNLARLPPLREVKLIFDKPVEVDEVFRALEPFANTLINFEGSQRKNDENLTGIISDIKLPNLRKFKLPDFTGPLDPFIKLTSLSDLTVACPDSQNYVEGSIVEFHGSQKPLKDSNIWKLIPSLQRLTVGDSTTYRPLTKQNRRSKRKCVLNAKKYF